MSYTTNKLIADAYFASGILSREFETVSGDEVANGLTWLNEILDTKVVEKELIPYEGTTTFTSVIGQEEYSISNLIKVDTLTFEKETVRYAMRLQPRDAYHGNTRVNGIDSLPYKYWAEREFGGTRIYLYFDPDQAYTFTIFGIFRLADVALGQDLELTLEKFYLTYLRYALADKICTEFAMPVPIGVQKELARYQALIAKQSRPMDVSVRKLSTLQKQQRLGWAWVNLGQGWLP